MIETLQSLRFIFFLMIFMSHFRYAGVEGFEAGGKCGVSFFFMLSGFILAYVYGSRIKVGGFDRAAFFRKRLSKIYPVHLLCLSIFFIFNVRVLDAEGYVRLLSNLLLVQSWIPLQEFYFSGNAESWFLSSILFCYAVFPRLFRAVSGCSIRTFRLGWTVMAGLYLLLVSVLPEKLTDAVIYINPAVRSVDFAIGIALWRISGMGVAERMGYGRSIIGDTLMETGAAVACALALVYYPYADAKFALASLFWPVLAVIMLLFASNKGKGLLSSLLRCPFLIYMGEVSFLMFMVHTIAINLMQAAVGKLAADMFHSWHPGYMAVLCLCMAATWIGALGAGKVSAALRDRIRIF